MSNSGDASIWGGGVPTVPLVNANSSYLTQRFVATAGQTIFTLTSFVFAPATASLLVEINGVGQFIGNDYTEGSTGLFITVTSALQAGDVVVVRGLIGVTGAPAAAISASQAAVSAATATTQANTATTQAGISTAQAVVSTNQATAAAASAASLTAQINAFKTLSTYMMYQTYGAF